MKRSLVISLLFSTAALAGEHMTVAVCNVDELPALVIEHAEAEAAYVFQSMDVEIRWTGCGAEVDAADARMRPDFIVRVRVGGHLPKAGATSLEAMGRAFRVGALIDRRRSSAQRLDARGSKQEGIGSAQPPPPEVQRGGAGRHPAQVAVACAWCR